MVFQLNGLKRKDLGWGILGQTEPTTPYLNTHHNPSDDPSREVPSRKPVPPPDWMKDLMKPDLFHVNENAVPLHMRLCKELFSGKACLSRCWTQAGLWVGRPFEAHPKKGVYVSFSDLLNPDVINYLVAEICEGRYWYLHFGTPCKTWGPAARRSGCTRTRLAPGGDGSLTREIEANEEARMVAMLCALIAKHGGFFSIENPAGSYLFLYEPIAALSIDFECYVASFPQCAYGLQLPGAPPDTFAGRIRTY